MISKRTHLKSKRSGRKRLRQKKSGPTNRTNRPKSRMSKISKRNSSKVKNVVSNDNFPYLEKIIRSLQAIAAERRVPYVTAVDDLRALLVVCEESMDTVGANTGHVARNFNGKQADFTNSLISINGFLQSLQALDHQISKVDVHYLIKELNLSSNISNDLICYDIFLDSLVDATTNTVTSRDNGAKNTGPQ